MKFPGIDAFLAKYQERARGAGVDPIGFWSPFGFAELQVLSQAVAAVGSIDQANIAAYMHKTSFKTVLGDIKFGSLGEWEKSRILFIQYQNIQGHDINQFRQAGKAVILSPREFKSGELIYPYAKIRSQ
jgi:branched-chain amino acid transport system substrate-binding protein